MSGHLSLHISRILTALFSWNSWLTYSQINNNLVSQAAVMNTHGLPSDVLSNLDPFALVSSDLAFGASY